MSPEALYNLGTWNCVLATAWDPEGGGDSRDLPSLGILAYSHKNLSDIILCQRTHPKKEMYSVTFHFGKKEHTFTVTVTSITVLSYKKSR